MRVLLDASALLAAILHEPGHHAVLDALQGDVGISAVNVCETVSKLTDRRWTAAEIGEIINGFGLEIAAFDGGAAFRAGLLRGATRSRGLSLGDRACLALAIAESARVLTADRAWAGLELGIEIDMIR